MPLLAHASGLRGLRGPSAWSRSLNAPQVHSRSFPSPSKAIPGTEPSVDVPLRIPRQTPPLRFLPLQRLPTQSSGIWAGLPHPTASASRFSQPLDAFIRPELAGLISCRIRSWGSPYRAFFLTVQPYAVSGAAPLMVLVHPTRTSPPSPNDNRRYLGHAVAPKPERI
jgi:hypothetical protein